MRKATSQKILTNPLEDLSGRASINLQPSPVLKLIDKFSLKMSFRAQEDHQQGSQESPRRYYLQRLYVREFFLKESSESISR